VAKSAVTQREEQDWSKPHAGRPFWAGVRLEAALAVLQRLGTMELEQIGESDHKEGRIRYVFVIS
jgi:hypothetical protein